MERVGVAPAVKSSLLVSLAVLSAAALAGCAGGEKPDGPAPEEGCPTTPFDPTGVRRVDPSHDPLGPLIDRDPWDFEATNVRTCSLPAIGWSALAEDNVPHKYIGEMDMRGDLDLGAVAVLGNGEPSRVYLVDITDRAAPQVLAAIDQEGVYLVDVKFSDDGQVLYLASQNLPTDGELSGLPELAPPTGFSVYNVEDPAAPAYLGFVADPQVGCHMLDPVQVAAGQDAVFCVSQQVRSYLIQRDGPVLVNLGFVDLFPTDGGVPVPSGVPALGDPTGSLSSGPHDMTAYHEGGAFGEGRSHLVVSHWDSGVRVFDITDAPLVTQVGVWQGEGARHYDGNVHTAMMFDTAEGRYLIASPEMTYPGVVPALWVLKADDLGALELVGEWYHPGEYTSDGNGTGGPLLLTTHQWQVAPTGAAVSVEDVRIYLTYNHGGIWVLDLGAVLAGDNAGAVLGFNLARAPLDPEVSVGNAVLSTWDVNVVDGHIYGTDRATGLWVFHYQGDTLGDARLTGFA